ncbi:MAG TPA: hypothetical protein DDW90_03970 [Cyanobacteria bacterium UBA9971]|nr:hypothetical protein [Cyanobacteria bacterium UBA9971]
MVGTESIKQASTNIRAYQGNNSSSKGLRYFNNSKDTVSFTGNMAQIPQKAGLLKFVEEAKGVLIEATEKLLQGFKSKTIQSIHEIAPENLVAVHLTDYMPVNGIIKTTRAATKDANGASAYRNTVHFALNHGVYEHQLGNWNDKKIAVLAPLDGIMRSNSRENIIGGEIKDFFIKDSVKLPEGSIIVRHNPDIPNGKLKVINGEAIDEFKNTKGIKVLETSGNVRETANKAVEMMGYTRMDKMQQEMAGIPEELINIKQEDLFSNPELLEKSMSIDISKTMNAAEEINKSWESFVKANGFKRYQHTTSPYGRSEALIEGVKLAALKGNSWEHEMAGSFLTKKGEKINYREEFLKIIQEIKQSLGKDEKLTYDIDKLENILKEAKDPQKAIQLIEERLKLKPMIPIEKCLSAAGADEVKTDDIYQLLDGLIGISPINKMQFSR